MDVDRIRRSFPLLTLPDDERPVYFDNACTTLKPMSVIDAVQTYYRETPVCGGRSIHRLGERVSNGVEAARRRLQKFVGARAAEEIVFTRGTTEAINLVAHGLRLRRGDVVVTTDKEHNSNWVPWLQLRDEVGIAIRIVESAEDGSFQLAAYESALREAGENLRLVSMAHVSNADGVEIPAKEVVSLAHERGAKVLLDAAQFLPHQRVDVDHLGVDFLAASAHKMLGPSGLGFLYGKIEALNTLQPLLYGGGAVKRTTVDSFELHDVPMRFEAGLQNYAAILALPPALDFLDEIGRDEAQRHEGVLNEYATKRLGEIRGVTIYGPLPAGKRGSILPFNLDGLGPHDVALYLDESSRVAVRSGAHCVNSYFQRRGLDGWVRASFYVYNTLREVDVFVDALERLAAGLRVQSKTEPA